MMSAEEKYVFAMAATVCAWVVVTLVAAEVAGGPISLSAVIAGLIATGSWAGWRFPDWGELWGARVVGGERVGEETHVILRQACLDFTIATTEQQGDRTWRFLSAPPWVSVGKQAGDAASKAASLLDRRDKARMAAAYELVGWDPAGARHLSESVSNETLTAFHIASRPLQLIAVNTFVVLVLSSLGLWLGPPAAGLGVFAIFGLGIVLVVAKGRATDSIRVWDGLRAVKCERDGPIDTLEVWSRFGRQEFIRDADNVSAGWTRLRFGEPLTHDEQQILDSALAEHRRLGLEQISPPAGHGPEPRAASRNV